MYTRIWFNMEFNELMDFLDASGGLIDGVWFNNELMDVYIKNNPKYAFSIVFKQYTDAQKAELIKYAEDWLGVRINPYRIIKKVIKTRGVIYE